MKNETKIISVEAQEILNESQKTSKESTSAIKFTSSLKAILFSFIIGIILIMITNNFAEHAVEYNSLTLFQQIWEKNFGNLNYFSSMLSRMSYLIPLGLSLVVSFRMGIFNIGASGQAFLGGIVAYVVGSLANFGPLGFIVTIAAGAATGMFLAWIIALLKNKFNINEVITSIMLNWIAFYIIMQFRNGIKDMDLYSNNDLRFDFINNFFGLFGDNVSSHVNIGIVIMIPLAIVIAILYSKTKWGFKQDLIGNNPNTGNYLGIDSKKEIYRTMMISGALAGFAGTVYLTGFEVTPTVLQSQLVEIPGGTFDGIAIALIGYNSPFGIIASSFLFSLLKASGLDDSIGNFHIVDIIIGLMVVFIALSALRVKYGKKRRGDN